MEKTGLMQLYNFLTRKKETFKPIRQDWVGFYACGPTVYNYAHIGNLRTYIFEDILRRTLKSAGYQIKQVMNITDVEDKLIRDAQKAGKNISDFVKPFEQAFHEDLKKLNIEKAEIYPKATKHIPEMIALVEKLLAKGLAYESNGSVYFNISKFKKYGRLSGIDKADLKAGARVDADEYNKEDVQDFVLWKGVKPEDEAVGAAWDAPFGRGRPGWHIECSAMSMRYLGETFDIHTGGIDLLFPHHENEIAQSEGSTGEKFAHFFVEGEHLLADYQKMSKSLGNFYTLRDVEEKGYEPLAFRYLILNAHYRSHLNFTWESLEAAKNGLRNLRNDILRLKQLIKSYNKFDLKNPKNREKNISKNFKLFQEALFADLSTPSAIEKLMAILTPNAGITKDSAELILKTIQNVDKILKLDLGKYDLPPEEIEELAIERKKDRDEKNWPEADKIRKKLDKAGWEIEDTENWFFLKKKT